MKGLEKIINSTFRNAAKNFFFLHLRVFKMSFCSACMFLLLFALHTKNVPWGAAVRRQAGPSGQVFLLTGEHCCSHLQWNHTRERHKMASEWQLSHVHLYSCKSRTLINVKGHVIIKQQEPVRVISSSL